MTQGWNRKYGDKECPRPGGVNTQSTPAAMGPDQFAKLVNIRWGKSGIRPRPGYAKVMASVLHDEDAKLYPHYYDVATPFRAWYTAAGCPGESAGSGTFTGFYDPEASPAIQRATWYSSALDVAHMGFLGNTPFVGVDDALRKMNLAAVPFGVDQIGVAGSSSDITIHSWPTETINLLDNFDGMLFVFLDAATPHAATFDGVSIREDFDFPSKVVASGRFRDLLIAGCDDGKLYSRAAGDSPVTWTLLGTVTGGVNPGRNSILSHNDKLYILEQESDDIWSWDGTTLGVAQTVTGTVWVRALAEAFGYLYYAHHDAATTEAHVGRYDASGPTWVDDHKRLTDDDAGIDMVTAMSLYKNELCAMVRDSGTMKFGLTSGQAVTGTWTFAALAANFGTQVPDITPI